MSADDRRIPRSISEYLEGFKNAKHIPAGFCNEIGYSTLEQATRYAENGKCQVLLLLVCIIGISTTSAFPTIMNNKLQVIQCQFDMIFESRRALNNVVCISSVMGGVAASFTADALSRKWTLIACLVLHGFGCGIITVIRSFKQFLYLRALISITSSSITAITVAFLSEYQLRYYRGSVITCLQFGWLLGVIAVPFISFNDAWIYQVRLIVIPSLLSAFLLIFFPESPRFLLSRKRPKRALRALQFIFSVNTGKRKEDYPIRHLIDNKTPSCLRRRSVKHYDPPGLEPQFICIPIVMFGQFIFMFSYCTVTFWFPIMNQRLPGIFPLHNNSQIPQDCVVGFHVTPPHKNNSRISGRDTDDLKFLQPQRNKFGVTSINETANTICDLNSKEDLFFKINIMTNVITCMPLMIFTVLKIDIIGRKFFIILAHFVAACMSFASFYMHSNGQKDLLFACLFDSMIIISIAVAQCLAVELFHTKIRAFGVALVSASGSVGLLHAANGGIFIYNLRCITLFALCSFFLEISGIGLMMLPDTAGINLR